MVKDSIFDIGFNKVKLTRGVIIVTVKKYTHLKFHYRKMFYDGQKIGVKTTNNSVNEIVKETMRHTNIKVKLYT